MKITDQGMMTERQEEAHLHMPCPVCGKLNTPYSYEDGWFLPNRRKYSLCCRNTSLQEWTKDDDMNGHDLLGFKTVKGCECKWEIVVNAKEEFKKSNLRLNENQVHELTKFIGNDDVILREEIRKIQSLYWNEQYKGKERPNIRRAIKNRYIKFLKFVIKVCNK